MAKGSSQKSTKKEIARKEKGPKPDYKIPKFDRESYKDVFARDIESAKVRLIHASSKDKWIYYIEYKALKKEKYSGNTVIIRRDNFVKKITY